jgi:alpha-beta hydrolase superfamily lysophospholipase
MTPLTEKRLLKVLGKADHRYEWYVRTYPEKSAMHPAEASKRWWEAMVSATQEFDFGPQDVLDAMGPEKKANCVTAYSARAQKRWGLTV